MKKTLIFLFLLSSIAAISQPGFRKINDSMVLQVNHIFYEKKLSDIFPKTFEGYTVVPNQAPYFISWTYERIVDTFPLRENNVSIPPEYYDYAYNVKGESFVMRSVVDTTYRILGFLQKISKHSESITFNSATKVFVAKADDTSYMYTNYVAIIFVLVFLSLYLFILRWLGNIPNPNDIEKFLVFGALYLCVTYFVYIVLYAIFNRNMSSYSFERDLSGWYLVYISAILITSVIFGIRGYKASRLKKVAA